MRPGDDREDTLGPDTSVVDRAASALRAYTDDGWSHASHRILATVLAATRRSRPVRAVGDGGGFHVSDQVLTTYLREAIDAVDGMRATHIGLELDGDVLTALDLTVDVRYPERIVPLAEAVRATALACVRRVLGDVRPALGLDGIHVHVGDVRPPEIGPDGSS